MTDNNKKQNIKPETSHIASEVLKRIASESITPTSRFKLLSAQWGVWIVWLATIVSGAAALSVSFYVTMSANYALYEATHANFVTFFVVVMPYVWVFLFVAMVYVSMFQIRNTTRGYRYSTWVVITSSLMFTVLGATLLHCFSLGYVLDQKLGQQLGSYMSQTKVEQKLWQMPQAGRLVGKLEQLNQENVSAPVFNFKDEEGVLWRLNVNELRSRDTDLLVRGGRVRILGTTTNEFSFHVCGVFPAMGDRAFGFKEMARERRDFDSTMREHARLMMTYSEGNELNEHQIVPKDRFCAHLEIMKRMQH